MPKIRRHPASNRQKERQVKTTTRSSKPSLLYRTKIMLITLTAGVRQLRHPKRLSAFTRSEADTKAAFKLLDSDERWNKNYSWKTLGQNYFNTHERGVCSGNTKHVSSLFNDDADADIINHQTLEQIKQFAKYRALMERLGNKHGRHPLALTEAERAIIKDISDLQQMENDKLEQASTQRASSKKADITLCPDVVETLKNSGAALFQLSGPLMHSSHTFPILKTVVPGKNDQYEERYHIADPATQFHFPPLTFDEFLGVKEYFYPDMSELTSSECKTDKTFEFSGLSKNDILHICYRRVLSNNLDEDIFRSAIKHGVSLHDHYKDNSATLLEHALGFGSIDTVKMLLEVSDESLATSPNPQHILKHAFHSNHNPEEKCKLVFDQGLKGTLSAKDLYAAVAGGKLSLVNLALDGGVNPNEQIKYEGDNYEILHAAVENAHVEVVKALHAKGVSLNKIDGNGFTALDIAVLKLQFQFNLKRSGHPEFNQDYYDRMSTTAHFLKDNGAKQLKTLEPR